MANFNYGNSFNSYEGENVGVERISVWKSVREFFPGGAVLKPEDYINSNNSDINYIVSGAGSDAKPGLLVPAGTPIGVDKPGGRAIFGTATNQGKPPATIGLTYEDVVLGTDGATFTIVTQGEFLVSRKQGKEIPDEVMKNYLFGRISFIKEV